MHVKSLHFVCIFLHICNQFEFLSNFTRKCSTTDSRCGTRVTTLKILGFTITSTLSKSDHICEVIKSCAQTQYASRILLAHGLSDSGLYTVFRSVAITKIIYASSAWSGFANKRDVQRIDAFLRRNKKCGLCQPVWPDYERILRYIVSILVSCILRTS